MAVNPLNSSSLEQLALKGLIITLSCRCFAGLGFGYLAERTSPLAIFKLVTRLLSLQFWVYCILRFSVSITLVGKYDYIIVRTKSQPDWLNSPHLPILPPPVTAKQRMVIIPGDQPEEGIDGYVWREFENRNVL